MQFDRLSAGISEYDLDPEKLQTSDGDFAALHEVRTALVHGFFSNVLMIGATAPDSPCVNV